MICTLGKHKIPALWLATMFWEPIREKYFVAIVWVLILKLSKSFYNESDLLFYAHKSWLSTWRYRTSGTKLKEWKIKDKSIIVETKFLFMHYLSAPQGSKFFPIVCNIKAMKSVWLFLSARGQHKKSQIPKCWQYWVYLVQIACCTLWHCVAMRACQDLRFHEQQLVYWWH